MNGTFKSIFAIIVISLHSGCLPAVRVGAPAWAVPPPGSGRVPAVYLESGRQLEVRDAGADVGSILAREGLDPGQVVAVTGIPRDRLARRRIDRGGRWQRRRARLGVLPGRRGL